MNYFGLVETMESTKEITKDYFSYHVVGSSAGLKYYYDRKMNLMFINAGKKFVNVVKVEPLTEEMFLEFCNNNLLDVTNIVRGLN